MEVMTNQNIDIRHKDVWTTTHEKLTIEVCRHAVGELVNDGKGIWCYYVYIREDQCPIGFFDKLWLPDIIIRSWPTSPNRITHHYEHLFPSCEWHGGVTYYAKHGHVPGHRCVQIGCDFSHLWDSEKNFDYRLKDIIFEAQRTAALISKELNEPLNP